LTDLKKAITLRVKKIPVGGLTPTGEKFNLTPCISMKKEKLNQTVFEQRFSDCSNYPIGGGILSFPRIEPPIDEEKSKPLPFDLSSLPLNRLMSINYDRSELTEQLVIQFEPNNLTQELKRCWLWLTGVFSWWSK